MKANLSSVGIHDVLTFLPAPEHFYECIYREISIIERNREHDLPARIGLYEFFLAVNTFPESPTEITGRILSIWRDEDSTFSYSSAQYVHGDGALSLMKRVDSSKGYSL